MKTTIIFFSKSQQKSVKVFLSFSLIILLNFCFSWKTSAQNMASIGQDNTVLASNTTNTSGKLFSSFESIALDGKVYLKWFVKDKDNSKTYIIERSVDGISFETTGALNVNGGKYDIIILNCFTDKNPAEGYSYYRIVANNGFGEKEYSDINAVYNKTKVNNEMENNNFMLVKNSNSIEE